MVDIFWWGLGIQFLNKAVLLVLYHVIQYWTKAKYGISCLNLFFPFLWCFAKPHCYTAARLSAKLAWGKILVLFSYVPMECCPKVPLCWPIYHNLLQAFIQLLHAVFHLNVRCPLTTSLAQVYSFCFPENKIEGNGQTFFLHEFWRIIIGWASVSYR